MTRMGTPVDNGIAFIKSNANGTKNVYVALGVGGDGKPQDVIAMHLNRPGVTIDPDVTIVSASAALQHSTENVKVSAGADGIPVIRTRRRDLGPLLRA